jgi:hypothetical protein
MDLKQLPEDFREFIHFLNINEVVYLLIGGWAVGVYTVPRATQDIDFLIAVDDANLARLQAALEQFNAPKVAMEHFRQRGNVFRIGVAPVQIDILTEADGIDIEECYKNRMIVNVDGIEVSVIAKRDLISNKQATGRSRDFADLESLEDGYHELLQ